MVAVLHPHHKVIEILASLPSPLVAQLGSNPCVIRLQASLIDTRQIQLNLLHGLLQPLSPNGQVVRGVDPFNVWAEAYPPAHIERQVRAQPSGARVRGGIDQPRDTGPRRRVRKVVALCKVQRLAQGRGDDHVVHVDAPQAGGIDDRLGRDARRLARQRVPDVDAPPCAAGPRPQRRDPGDGRVERDDAARVLEQAGQRDHQAVDVDDARGRRLERAARGTHALPLVPDLPLRHPAHRHANVGAVRVQLLQLAPLGVVLRDDPFPRAPVRDAVLLAELVEQLLPAEA